MTKRKIGCLFLTVATVIVVASCARLKRWQEAHTPPDDACVHCHFAIYKDWKIAYRPYNEAAKKEDYEPVHSRPMSGEDVKMRRAHLEGKGECFECHIVQQPTEVLDISKIGIFFEDTIYQLCGRCHDNTFKEWERSRYFKEEVSCLVCHTDRRDMPLPEGGGYFHTVEGIEGFDPKMMRPSLMLERLKKAVSVEREVIVKGNKVGALLIVKNSGVGHNLPTDAINAALLIKLALVDSKGNIVDRKESVIGGWGKRSISPGRSSYLDFEMTAFSKGEHTLEITLSHSDREREKNGPVIIYQESFRVSVR